MKHLSWIILFPIAVILIIFLVTNRGGVIIDLWPLPIMVDVPLFAVMLVTLLMGVVWGGVSAWLNGARFRRTARQKTREADMMASENRRLKDRIAVLEDDARAPDASKAPQVSSDPAVADSSHRLPPPTGSI